MTDQHTETFADKTDAELLALAQREEENPGGAATARAVLAQRGVSVDNAEQTHQYAVLVRDLDGDPAAVIGPFATADNAADAARRAQDELAHELEITPESAPAMYSDDGWLYCDDSYDLAFMVIELLSPEVLS